LCNSKPVTGYSTVKYCDILHVNIKKTVQLIDLFLTTDDIGPPVSSFSALESGTRLLSRGCVEDALSLLKFVHPLEWPYCNLLRTMAKIKDLPEILTVLEQYLQWMGGSSVERLNPATITAVLSLQAVDNKRTNIKLVQSIRAVVKKIIQMSPYSESSELNLRKDFSVLVELMQENSSKPSFFTLHDGHHHIPDQNLTRFLEITSATPSRTLDELCSQLLQVLPSVDSVPPSQQPTEAEHPKSTWVDPESPQNLQRFITDISRLGRKTTLEWSPAEIINPVDDAPKTPVVGIKKSWKRHLRIEQQKR